MSKQTTPQHLEAVFRKDMPTVTVSRGPDPVRYSYDAYVERMRLGPFGKKAVPISKMAECVNPEYEYNGKLEERQLILMMDENGRALGPQAKFDIGGYVFYGTVHLVAVLYDDTTGSTWYTDVTDSDQDAVSTLLKRRRERDMRAIQQLQAQGVLVIR